MKNSHRKNLIALFCCFSSLFGLSGCHSSATSTHEKNTKTIGIIVPLEHKAMDEIVNGFTTTLQAAYPHTRFQFKVANAQNDLNLQRAIINQMKDSRDDLIVPIGTTAALMTMTAIHDKPIVSLAAAFSDQDRKRLHPCNVAIVHDEISSTQLIQFIHAVYPAITQLTLIHSPADKVFPAVKEAIVAGKALGMTITPRMVSSLSELYTAGNALSANTQGILILKDSLIVSGVSVLEKIAVNRHIPLITSDQGSVQDGGGFALGVHERQIGVDGATLAAQILAGKSACQLPIVNMTHLTVFINANSLAKEGQALLPIENAAHQLHYAIEKIPGA